MITRTVKLQLAAFALIALALISVLSAKYIGLVDKVIGGSYVVSVSLAESGGIFVGAEVTYRGVTVGRVDALHLERDGVRVDARLERGTEVPRDTRAVVENRSAVGEQYLDLQPETSAGPRLAAGDAIARDRTETPVRIDRLLSHVNATVGSVPRGALVTTVDELGKAFAGGGADLQRLLDSGDRLTAAAIEALPETIRLIDDGRVVLDTQVKSVEDLTTTVRGFADVAEALQVADPDLRVILDRGAIATGELTSLIRENKQALAALIANFITIGNVTTARLNGIEQLLVTYPEVVSGGYTVLPGDGTAHFGLVLNADDPPACEAGYEGTRKVDPHRTTDLPATNLDAHCAASRASGVNVRGAQNSPRPRPGQRGGASGPTSVPVEGVTSSGGGSLTVQTPVPQTGAAVPSWAQLMQEAVR
jgi:phospholipid/cholesterol/gamma-HCH transport system substrate-binding protein